MISQWYGRSKTETSTARRLDVERNTSGVLFMKADVMVMVHDLASCELLHSDDAVPTGDGSNVAVPLIIIIYATS